MMTKKLTLKNDEEALLLLGERDVHLRRIEAEHGVELFVRHEAGGEGLHLSVRGSATRVQKAWKRLKESLDRIRSGGPAIERRGVPSVGPEPSRRPASPFDDSSQPEDALYVSSYGKVIRPRGPRQAAYAEAMLEGSMTFGIGPAGTGKTFLAVACALRALKAREVSRIVLTRPVVEAGEKLGFLPGDLYEKVNPYLKPLYDAFYDMLGPDKFRLWRNDDIVEIVPLAYMRGRTLDNAFIILDEAQNTTIEQMKMFLTRMGAGSRIVVTGDVTQVDLGQGVRSGLVLAGEILKGVKEITFIRFQEEDVVRHPLVRQVIRAFEGWEKRS